MLNTLKQYAKGILFLVTAVVLALFYTVTDAFASEVLVFRHPTGVKVSIPAEGCGSVEELTAPITQERIEEVPPVTVEPIVEHIEGSMPPADKALKVAAEDRTIVLLFHDGCFVLGLGVPEGVMAEIYGQVA